MAAKKQVNPIIAVVVIVVILVIVGVLYSLAGRKTSTSKPLGGQEGMAKMKQMMQQKMQQGGPGGGR